MSLEITRKGTGAAVFNHTETLAPVEWEFTINYEKQLVIEYGKIVDVIDKSRWSAVIYCYQKENIANYKDNDILENIHLYDEKTKTRYIASSNAAILYVEVLTDKSGEIAGYVFKIEGPGILEDYRLYAVRKD